MIFRCHPLRWGGSLALRCGWGHRVVFVGGWRSRHWVVFLFLLCQWLFFFVIPFCSLFTHFALKHSAPNFFLGENITRKIAYLLIAGTCLLLCTQFSKAYTAVDALFLIVTLTLGVVFYLKLLQRFFLSFLIILIPFFIVNGILTGWITDSPIVWYNDLENLGIRLTTIPVEDIGYAFSMLFGNLMIFEFLKPKQDVR